MTKAKKLPDKAVASSKTKFQGRTKGLEGHIFHCGSGMDAMHLASKEKPLEHVGTKCTASKKLLLEEGKFTKDQCESKTCKEQKKLDHQMKKFTEAEATVGRNSSSIHTVIWGQITGALQNRIKSHHSHAKLRSSHNAMGSLKLVVLTVDHCESRHVDCLCSIPTFSGNKMSLGEFCEHFQERARMAPSVGVNFANEGLKWHVL